MDDEEPTRWYADDVVRGFLGLFVVPASLIAIAVVWVATGDPVRADGTSRWLQAIIIAVLGFYFGNADASRARRAERQAIAARQNVERAVVAQMLLATNLHEELEDMRREVSAFRETNKFDAAGGRNP